MVSVFLKNFLGKLRTSSEGVRNEALMNTFPLPLIRSVNTILDHIRSVHT